MKYNLQCSDYTKTYFSDPAYQENYGIRKLLYIYKSEKSYLEFDGMNNLNYDRYSWSSWKEFNNIDDKKMGIHNFIVIFKIF